MRKPDENHGTDCELATSSQSSKTASAISAVPQPASSSADAEPTVTKPATSKPAKSFAAANPCALESFAAANPCALESFTAAKSGATESFTAAKSGATESFAAAKSGATESFTTAKSGATESFAAAESSATESFAAAEPGVLDSFAAAEPCAAAEPGVTESFAATEPCAAAEPGVTESFAATEPWATESLTAAEPDVLDSFAAAEPCATESFATAEPCATESFAAAEPCATESFAAAEPGVLESFTAAEPGATESFAAAEPSATESFAAAEPGAAEPGATESFAAESFTATEPGATESFAAAEPGATESFAAYRPIPSDGNFDRIRKTDEEKGCYTVDGDKPQLLEGTDTLLHRCGWGGAQYSRGVFFEGRKSFHDKTKVISTLDYVIANMETGDDLTTLAVGIHAILKQGIPPSDEDLQVLSGRLGEAWERFQRHKPPLHLARHLEASPSLRRGLPPVKTMDSVMCHAHVPEPTVDRHGRRLHSLVAREDLVDMLFKNRCDALVWEISPGIAMARSKGGIYFMTSQQSGSLGSREDALKILEKCGESRVSCIVIG